MFRVEETSSDVLSDWLGDAVSERVITDRQSNWQINQTTQLLINN
jgi:hypothetical protein